jgi:hypothetical protein
MLYLRLSIVSFLAFFACFPIHVQQAPANCSAMEYEHRNPIHYGPWHLTSVRGTVKAIDGFPVFRACVGAFTESDHKLVTATHVDQDGGFQVSDVANGTYRLVVASEGFCAANVAIVLKNKAHGKKKLAAVMRPTGTDVCSYIELK